MKKRCIRVWCRRLQAHQRVETSLKHRPRPSSGHSTFPMGTRQERRRPRVPGPGQASIAFHHPVRRWAMSAQIPAPTLIRVPAPAPSLHCGDKRPSRTRTSSSRATTAARQRPSIGVSRILRARPAWRPTRGNPYPHQWHPRGLTHAPSPLTVVITQERFRS